MKDFLKFDNIKKLIFIFLKAFGIAVVFEILSKGIPAFVIVLIVSSILLYKR